MRNSFSGVSRVGHLDLQVARETFLSVGVEVLHHQTVFRGRNHVPDHAVQAFEPAVERLAVIVDRQAVLRASSVKLPLAMRLA